MNTRSSKALSLSIIIICLGLEACSHTTEPASTTSYPTVFKFLNSRYDEGFDTTIERILGTGLSFAGKNNVTMIRDSTRGVIDTFYLNWEANGDLSLYTHPEHDSLVQYSSESSFTLLPWITVPIASNRPFVFTKDTFYSATNISVWDSIAPDTGYAISTVGLHLPANRAFVLELTRTISDSMYEIEAGYDERLFYAPSIHYFVESFPEISSALFSRRRQ